MNFVLTYRMNIAVFKPSVPLLEKYIKCFFVLEQGAEAQSAFLIFPSLYPNLSFSKHTQTQITDDRVITHYTPAKPFESFLAAGHARPLRYAYFGKIYEISISFNPLGINSFFPQDLEFYIRQGCLDHAFYADLPSVMPDILAQQDSQQAIRQLEQYLLSKYQPFFHPLMEEIVAVLLEANGNMSIRQITTKYQISRQTLNLYFQKYIGRSAVESRRIIRFRSASEHFFQRTLTELTYDLHYFDQSHLIKDFKALTGLTPRQFFSKIYSKQDMHLIWI